MGHVTDIYGLATPHQQALIAKANRAMDCIDYWTDHYVEQTGVTKRQALDDMRVALTTTDDGESTWSLLATLHETMYPEHPGRAEFVTSRPVVLAKLDARIWSEDAKASADADADPFDGLV